VFYLKWHSILSTFVHKCVQHLALHIDSRGNLPVGLTSGSAISFRFLKTVAGQVGSQFFDVCFIVQVAKLLTSSDAVPTNSPYYTTQAVFLCFCHFTNSIIHTSLSATHNFLNFAWSRVALRPPVFTETLMLADDRRNSDRNYLLAWISNFNKSVLLVQFRK
jgi:hypothetical protein